MSNFAVYNISINNESFMGHMIVDITLGVNHSIGLACNQSCHQVCQPTRYITVHAAEFTQCMLASLHTRQNYQASAYCASMLPTTLRRSTQFVMPCTRTSNVLSQGRQCGSCDLMSVTIDHGVTCFIALEYIYHVDFCPGFQCLQPHYPNGTCKPLKCKHVSGYHALLEP